MVPVVTDVLARFIADRARAEERARNLIQALDGLDLPPARPGDTSRWLFAVTDAVSAIAREVLGRAIEDTYQLVLAANAVAATIIDYMTSHARAWLPFALTAAQ